jgi:hypothetical protein
MHPATAAGNELVIAGSLPFAAGVTLDSAGDVYVSSSGGGGAGAVAKIAAGAITPIIAGLDFASGIAFDAAGDLLVAETLVSFDSRWRSSEGLISTKSRRLRLAHYDTTFV